MSDKTTVEDERRFFAEDQDERRMFDHAARLCGGPLRAIAASLTIMAQAAPGQGSYGKMLKIYSNECARAADRAQENPMPSETTKRALEAKRFAFWSLCLGYAVGCLSGFLAAMKVFHG